MVLESTPPTPPAPPTGGQSAGPADPPVLLFEPVEVHAWAAAAGFCLAPVSVIAGAAGMRLADMIVLLAREGAVFAVFGGRWHVAWASGGQAWFPSPRLRVWPGGPGEPDRIEAVQGGGSPAADAPTLKIAEAGPLPDGPQRVEP